LIQHIFAHKCIHDEIDHQIVLQEESEEVVQEHNRLLQSSIYSPIRIVPSYEGLTGVAPDAYDFLTTQLMPAAISFFTNSLSVVPYPALLSFPTQLNCYNASIPLSYITTGVQADFVLFLTSVATTGSFMWSSTCVQSAVGNRPLAAQLNINPNYINVTNNITNAPLFWNQLSVLLHEMTHALGFSATLYPTYTGMPNVTQVFNNVRGLSVTQVILPNIIAKVRAYFNCSNATGLELENQGTNATVMTSHWERRIVGQEIMTSTYLHNPIYSPFTLGMLEASGWYYVNYTLARNLTWGWGRGCGFLYSNCINVTYQAQFPEFCSNINVYGCTYDQTNKAQCAGTLGSPYPYWNYFLNNTVSNDSYSDNCPYFTAISNGDCRLSSNMNSSNNLFDETYGTNSMCFGGTLTKNTYPQFFDNTSPRGMCFSYNCSTAGDGWYSLSMKIGNQTVNCPSYGGATIAANYLGYVICPNPQVYCYDMPDCPNNCSSNGICVNGVCQCYMGYNLTDCSNLMCPGNCSGNGVCVNNTCDCVSGYGGGDCLSASVVANCSDCLGLLDCWQGRCECYPTPGRNCTWAWNKYLYATSNSSLNSLYPRDYSGSAKLAIGAIIPLIFVVLHTYF
jgi:hypothetical protein